MSDEPITLTQQQARWLLEAIECAYSEGWPGGQANLPPAQQGQLAVELTRLAGMDVAGLWWLGTNLVEGWSPETGAQP